MIEQETRGHSVVIRLFRRWSASEQAGHDALGSVLELTRSLNQADQLAHACVSFFQLVEGQLSRRLVAECCCSRSLSADEHALLGIYHSAAIAPALAKPDGVSAAHGLPSAIGLMVVTIREELGLPAAPDIAEMPGEQAPTPVTKHLFSRRDSATGISHGI